MRKGPTPGPAGGPARGVLALELSFVGLCHGTPGNGTTGLGGGDASGPSPGAGEFPAPLGESLDPLCSYVPHPARSPGTEASPAPGPTPPEPGRARPPSLARADSPTRLPVFLRAPPAPSAPRDWLGAPTSALTYVLGLGPPPRQARRCMGRGVTGAGPDLSWPGGRAGVSAAVGAHTGSPGRPTAPTEWGRPGSGAGTPGEMDAEASGVLPGGRSPYRCQLPCWAEGCSREPLSPDTGALSVSGAQCGERPPTPQAPIPCCSSARLPRPVWPARSQLLPSAPLEIRGAAPACQGNTQLREGRVLGILGRRGLVNPGS